MRILFLDIDGVLVPIVPGWDKTKIRLELALNLIRVIQETGCQVVISSDWRFDMGALGSAIEEALGDQAHILLDNIIARTPDVTTQWNGEDEYEPQYEADRVGEIMKWLSDRKDVDHWVVVDDLSLPMLKEHLVVTDERLGLNSEKTDELVQKLNRKS